MMSDSPSVEHPPGATKVKIFRLDSCRCYILHDIILWIFYSFDEFLISSSFRIISHEVRCVKHCAKSIVWAHGRPVVDCFILCSDLHPQPHALLMPQTLPLGQNDALSSRIICHVGVRARHVHEIAVLRIIHVEFPLCEHFRVLLAKFNISLIILLFPLLVLFLLLSLLFELLRGFLGNCHFFAVVDFFNERADFGRNFL